MDFWYNVLQHEQPPTFKGPFCLPTILKPPKCSKEEWLCSKLFTHSYRCIKKFLFYFHSTKPDLLTSIIFFCSTQILWAAMPPHLRSRQRQTRSSTDTQINSFWFMSHSWLATDASKMTLGLPSGFPAVGEFLPYKSIWNYGRHPTPHPQNPDTVTTSVSNILVQDTYT